MMRASFPLDPTSAFRASMSERYRQAFDDGAIREHAAIVARRGESQSREAHVEIWRQLPKGVGVLCVVADDRPGLLSFVCASLVVHKMDVLSAQAYTRRLPEARAARAAQARPSTSSGCVATPTRTIRCRCSRRTSSGSPGCCASSSRASSRSSPWSSAPDPRVRCLRAPSTNVTFDEDDDEGLVVLTVETFDRPGLLLAITLALFRANVQIIASDAVTRAGRVVDRFSIVEVDGSPIRRSRRGVVQIEVLEAIHALSRR